LFLVVLFFEWRFFLLRILPVLTIQVCDLHYELNLEIMDKRSFNFLFSIVAVSMVIMGTYKISKRRNHLPTHHIPVIAKNNK